jgi:hypothetical protein
MGQIAEQDVSPVLVGRALESLRNSDFDTLSAIGEALDNSIEANSRKINLSIEIESLGKKQVPNEVAFADDGIGMNKDTLHRCLQLGYSTSYNDREGIGRFGVGMTLGAIAQCRRIEVYSKMKGGDWNFTYLDLDELANEPLPYIPRPTRKEVPKQYRDQVGEPGTLVIWKKLDRFSAKDEDIHHWIARTYRKFIGEDVIQDNKIVANKKMVKISLNGNIIHAHDPLFVTKNKNFPDDPRAKLAREIKIPFSIPQIDIPPKKSSGTSEIIIRTSLLPEKWRPKSGAGTFKTNTDRHIDANSQGISILRNDREVFFGEIPYFGLNDEKGGKGFIDIDRWWGCEISFRAELDHWFSVKNIKVGARPLPELRKVLLDMLKDTIYEYRREVRRVWDEYKTNESKSSKGSLGGNEEAETVLKEVVPKLTGVTPQETKTAIDTLLEKAAVEKDLTQAVKDKLSELPVTIRENYEADRRGPFIDVVAELGKTLISFNMNHPFFVYTNDILKQIDKSKSEAEDKENMTKVQRLKASLSLLIGAFAVAQREIDEDEMQPAGDTIEKLIHNWTFYLKKAIENLSQKTK